MIAASNSAEHALIDEVLVDQIEDEIFGLPETARTNFVEAHASLYINDDHT